MCRIFYIQTLLFCLSVNYCVAQVTQLREDISMNGDQILNLEHATALDGGTLIMATTQSVPAPSQVFITLIKLDASGVEQWHKRFNSGNAKGVQIVTVPDSGYFFTAVEYASYSNIFTRIDKNGNIIFSKKYLVPPSFDESFYNTGYSIARNGGGFYVASTVYDSVNSKNNWCLTKLDNMGNVFWSHIYSGGNASVYGIDTTANGDIVLSGTMLEPTTNKEFAVILRADSSGTIRWYKCYKSPLHNLSGMSTDIDGQDNIYVVSSLDSFTAPSRTFLMKVNSFGNASWANCYSVYMYTSGNFIHVEPNQDIVVAGLQYFMKTNPGGQIVCARKHQQLWMYSFDAFANGKYSYAAQSWITGGIQFYTSDNCGRTCLDSAMSYSIQPILFYDSTLSGNNVFSVTSSAYTWVSDTVTVSTQIVCTIVSLPEENSELEGFEIFPSPVSDVLHINCSSEMESIQIFNCAGQLVSATEPGDREANINVSQYANGIYFVQIRTDSEFVQKKIVILQ